MDKFRTAFLKIYAVWLFNVPVLAMIRAQSEGQKPHRYVVFFNFYYTQTSEDLTKKILPESLTKEKMLQKSIGIK